MAAQVDGDVSRPLHSKHRPQNTQQLIQRSLRQSPQVLDKTIPINSPQLIGYNVAVFAIKPATHTKRISMTAGCEGCNNKSAKVSIQFIR